MSAPDHFETLLMHSLMHPGCSGSQHEDCVRLLQRLQAAADQPITSGGSGNSAAAASSIADALCELPRDWVDAPLGSVSASKGLLTVQKVEARGRQLAVTQDAAAGTVLWKEKPFVHFLLKQHRKQVRLVLLADRHTLQCTVVLHASMSSSFQQHPLFPRNPGRQHLTLHSWHTTVPMCKQPKIISRPAS